jgi:hypothetical protein
MPTERDILIQKKVLKALDECGDYLLLESFLFDAAAIKVPQLRKSEFDYALSCLDSAGRIRSIRAERGVKWAITDAGRLNLQSND